jgi:chaperonin GroEL (HSP60 family)
VESVERAAAKVGSEIKIRLQDLPRRIAPRILAMAASGSNEREVQEALEREIDDGIEAVRTLLGAPIV